MSKSIMTMFLVPTAKTLLRPTNVTRGLANFQLAKNFSSKQLTPTVAFVSNGSTKHLRNRPNLSEYSSEGRPLTVLICWLMAKNNAVNKYTKFYLDQGFDVLTVRITPWQLLLPARVDPIIRNEILPALLSSDHEKKLIHGFSVGGYVFAQMLKHMHNDPTGKCQDLMKSMMAQIWDSVVDVNGISIGVSKSVFISSPFFQKAMQGYIDFHLKAFQNIATKYYDEAHEYFYKKPLHAPALFLASEIDQISTIDVIQDIQKIWGSYDIACANKTWNNTSHVGHMRRYPEEYKLAVKMFIDKSGFKRGARAVDVQKETVIPAGRIPNVVYSKSI
ncbi:unnamed protein product [Orchesella dallaii]|uniref:Transmembrane protein 53 n=1 Tax=Orchesella dallaii TaxID=48710 RepID=A0ABP1R1V3_9HEXA